MKKKISVSLSPDVVAMVESMSKLPAYRNKSHVIEMCVRTVIREGQ